MRQARADPPNPPSGGQRNKLLLHGVDNSPRHARVPHEGRLVSRRVHAALPAAGRPNHVCRRRAISVPVRMVENVTVKFGCEKNSMSQSAAGKSMEWGAL